MRDNFDWSHHTVKDLANIVESYDELSELRACLQQSELKGYPRVINLYLLSERRGRFCDVRVQDLLDICKDHIFGLFLLLTRGSIEVAHPDLELLFKPREWDYHWFDICVSSLEINAPLRDVQLILSDVSGELCPVRTEGSEEYIEV